jgi:hypothetical protein
MAMVNRLAFWRSKLHTSNEPDFGFLAIGEAGPGLTDIARPNRPTRPFDLDDARAPSHD